MANELATTSYDAFGVVAHALSGEGKPILRFNKGDWVVGAEAEEVDAGTRMACNIMESEWGWIYWHDKKPEDRRMVPVASGQQIPGRGDLGRDDKALWPTDSDNRPQDPWQKNIEIPCRELDGDMRELTLAGSSKGFEGACRKLFKQFSEEGRTNPGKVPMVELGVDRYKHPTYGMVKVPTMTIVEWADPDDLAEAKPKAKSKGSSKF